jgi:hypothetical protein
LKNLDEGYPGIFYAVVATFRAKMFFKKCKKKKKSRAGYGGSQQSSKLLPGRWR